MAHRCHATGCQVPVPPERLMCRAHWFAVPKLLRARVWATYRAGQCDDMNPSRDYCEAAKAAVMAVAAREGRAPDTALYDLYLRASPEDYAMSQPDPALVQAARRLVDEYNAGFFDQENNTPRPWLVRMIAAFGAAQRVEEREKRAACVYRLKMARFVFAGLPNAYPETRRSDVLRRMVEIIDATLAANTDFDAGDEDFDAALRAARPEGR